MCIKLLSKCKHEEADEVAVSSEEWEERCAVEWVPSSHEAVDEEEEAVEACFGEEVEEII